MRNYELGRGLLPGRDSLPLIAAVGGLYLLVTLGERVLSGVVSIPAFSVVELTAALPVPVLLAAGPAAMWGIPLGLVLSDAATSSLGPGTLVSASAHLYLGYATCSLLRRFDGDAPRLSVSVVRERIGLGRFVLAVALAAAGAAAVFGWGGELTHRTPFFVAAPVAFAELALLSVPFALPLAGLFERAASAGTSAFGVTAPLRRQFDGRPDLRRVAGVSVGWLAVGTVASVGYRTFEKVPAGAFTSRDLEFVLLLRQPALFGPGAGRLQVLLGAVLLSVLVVLLAEPSERAEVPAR
ncbi:hypothetical protein [Halorubrum halophilum]|uniref:hypothetical protein n=1 Tax=Halorubrum halophilum TaxID=413816 RepID=UPI000679DB3A|nr:hypothetical protein [Halorubrum halophilum]